MARTKHRKVGRRHERMPMVEFELTKHLEAEGYHTHKPHGILPKRDLMTQKDALVGRSTQAVRSRRRGRITPRLHNRIEPVHRPIEADIEHGCYSLDAHSDHFSKHRSLMGIRSTQNVSLHGFSMCRPTDTELQSREILEVQVVHNGQYAPVPPCSSSTHNTNPTTRQVEVIMDHQDLAWGNPVITNELPHRLTAPIHERHRLVENRFHAHNLTDPPPRFELLLLQRNGEPSGQPVHHIKTRVVPRSLVLLSGIAESHYEKNDRLPARLSSLRSFSMLNQEAVRASLF